MTGLKDLWLQEGDLSRLLNDAWSVNDLEGFSVQNPQRSLLNSQRMYRKCSRRWNRWPKIAGQRSSVTARR